MTTRHIALAAIVLVASLVPMAAASTGVQTQADSEAYAGSHVSFQTNGSAIVGYAVDGETVASSVEVQSESEIESSLGLGISGDLAAVTDVNGAGLSMASSADASATVQVESGATVQAHDYGHGTLVVDADQSQYVALGLNASSEAEAESDDRVIVTTDDGTEAAVMVVGDGNVTVNEAGNVTANVKAESKLVVRSYSEGRTEEAESTEQLIVNGIAAAEVYADQQAGGAVTYDSDTEVTVEQRSESTVNMTIDRAEHQGKVVIASTSQFAAESNADVNVSVDGSAAATASSYSELRTAADDGSTSKYMVRNDASAEADAQVLVAVNHFSERTVSMTDADGSDGGQTSDGDDADSGDDTTDSSETDDSDATGSGNGPGFGVVAALLSLIGIGGFAARQH